MTTHPEVPQEQEGEVSFGLIECALCGKVHDVLEECDEDGLEDVHGYSRSDLLFGGNWS